MVTLRLTKPEALALLKAAETGLSVIQALHPVKATGLTEATVRKLRVAAAALALAKAPGRHYGTNGRRAICLSYGFWASVRASASSAQTATY